MNETSPYQTLRSARSQTVTIRNLQYHLNVWGEPHTTQPPLLMVHGWMDVGASFQFVVDALQAADGFERLIIAPDWRGFGLTQTPAADCYWFPDYVGDLDALVDAVSPLAPLDLLGHSMGGNVVMSYAGVRPQRLRKLINLEGFGLPRADAQEAPPRLVKWLDELKEPQDMRPYDSVSGVAERLLKNNPRLGADKAAWLATRWARQGADRRWHILGDAGHKRVNPMIYRADEILETWKLISAPLLWVEGDSTDTGRWWGQRYSKAEFHQRLNLVPQAQREVLKDCGHMLHHDQPEALAALLAAFLKA